LQEAFGAIDALGRKKEELRETRQIFEKFSDIVQQLPENGKRRGNMDTLLATIQQSLVEADAAFEKDTDTKPLTAWKKVWTELDGNKARIWRETARLQKQQALADIYEAYQSRLEEEGYIDFSDMIIRATEMIEADPMIQANLAELYQFILIDEYQDTNDAQMRLVESILSQSPESPNIFAVGDDDQSIYKFQGANIKNIRDFQQQWPDTRLIILDTNYRSRGEIISASRSTLLAQHDRISTIFPGAKKEFHASRGTGGEVIRKSFSNELYEISWIAEDIAKKIQSGIAPEDIAVIMRKNKSLETLGKLLLDRGIPVSMSRTESIWESDLVALIVDILRYLSSLTTWRPADDILVKIIAHPAWNIPRIELWKLSRDIYHARKPENKSWLEQMSASAIVEIRDVAYFLKELAMMSENTRLEDLIDAITGAASLVFPTEEDHEYTDQLQIDTLT